MKLIWNYSNVLNHLSAIHDLWKQSTRVQIISPFLSSDMNTIMNRLDFSNIQQIEIITTLKTKTSDQLRKLDSFRSLLTFTDRNPKLSVKIRINNNLHGKVYLFFKQSNLFAGIISSANFTWSGLNLNDEWGLELTDKILLNSIHESIESSCEYWYISREDIETSGQLVDQYRESNKEPKLGERIDLNLSRILRLRGTNMKTKETIWLKPIGHTGAPFKEVNVFSDEIHSLHFSRTRPSGVRIGDYIILYGVGTTKIISYFTVTSNPIHATDAEIKSESWKERWPWYVMARNNAPNFGREWWIHNLYINELVKNYLIENGDGNPITRVGGQTLGGLNRGHDKLNLAPHFGQYLISIIESLNKA